MRHAFVTCATAEASKRLSHTETVDATSPERCTAYLGGRLLSAMAQTSAKHFEHSHTPKSDIYFFAFRSTISCITFTKSNPFMLNAVDLFGICGVTGIGGGGGGADRIGACIRGDGITGCTGALGADCCGEESAASDSCKLKYSASADRTATDAASPPVSIATFADGAAGAVTIVGAGGGGGGAA